MISEVLGKDTGDKVPIEKVVMIIWQFRDDPQVVKFMTHFVAKVWHLVFTGSDFESSPVLHASIHRYSLLVRAMFLTALSFIYRSWRT